MDVFWNDPIMIPFAKNFFFASWLFSLILIFSLYFKCFELCFHI